MKSMPNIIPALSNDKLPQIFKQPIHRRSRKEFLRLLRTNSHLTSHVIDHIFFVMIYCSPLYKIKVQSDRHLQPFNMHAIVLFITTSLPIVSFLAFDDQFFVKVRKYLHSMLFILWTPFVCVASLPLN
jgi:hypothetical protein